MFRAAILAVASLVFAWFPTMGVCNVWFSATGDVPLLCGHNGGLQYLLWLPVTYLVLWGVVRGFERKPKEPGSDEL